MARKEILALAALLFAGADAAAQEHGSAPAYVAGWVPDLPSGKRLAQKTGRPLMIVFR